MNSNLSKIEKKEKQIITPSGKRKQEDDILFHSLALSKKKIYPCTPIKQNPPNNFEFNSLKEFQKLISIKELIESAFNQINNFLLRECKGEFLEIDLKMIAFIFSDEFTILPNRIDTSSISIFITEEIINTNDQIEKFILHPKNRIMFINGNIGSGKTTILLYAALKLKMNINYRIVYLNFALMPNKNYYFFIMIELFFTFAKEIENNIEIRNIFKLIFDKKISSLANAVNYLEEIRKILSKENIHVILIVDQIENYTQSENQKIEWIETLNGFSLEYDIYLVVCTSENDFTYAVNIKKLTQFVKLSDTFDLIEFKKYMLIKGSEKILKIIINNVDNCCDDDMNVVLNELLKYFDENDKKSDINYISVLSNNNLDIVTNSPRIKSGNCATTKEENLESPVSDKHSISKIKDLNLTPKTKKLNSVLLEIDSFLNFLSNILRLNPFYYNIFLSECNITTGYLIHKILNKFYIEIKIMFKATNIFKEIDKILQTKNNYEQLLKIFYFFRTIINNKFYGHQASYVEFIDKKFIKLEKYDGYSIYKCSEDYYVATILECFYKVQSQMIQSYLGSIESDLKELLCNNESNSKGIQIGNTFEKYILTVLENSFVKGFVIPDFQNAEVNFKGKHIFFFDFYDILICLNLVLNSENLSKDLPTYFFSIAETMRECFKANMMVLLIPYSKYFKHVDYIILQHSFTSGTTTRIIYNNITVNINHKDYTTNEGFFSDLYYPLKSVFEKSEHHFTWTYMLNQKEELLEKNQKLVFNADYILFFEMKDRKFIKYSVDDNKKNECKFQSLMLHRELRQKYDDKKSQNFFGLSSVKKENNQN